MSLALADLAAPVTGYDPLDWLGDLSEELDARRPALDHLGNYYEGRQRLHYQSEKWRVAFGGLFSRFADNFCQLVVAAVEERLDVEGFRFGDAEGDEDAWAIWQRNNLDADSELAHTEALKYGVAYATVWSGDDGLATVDIESPKNTIVAYEPGNRRRRVAALKQWESYGGTTLATLYMPDFVWKFQSKGQAGRSGWQPRQVGAEPWPLPNFLGVVPIVPIINMPRLLPEGHETEGQSEIAPVIPLQDAINKELQDMMVASEFGAYRQRWVTGLDIPRDPTTGEPVEPFRPGSDRLWMAENPEAHFGEFNQTDLMGYARAVELLVQHIATLTRTPPHYLFSTAAQFPSGESLRAAETGLVAKAKRKMRHLSEAWEEVMRLCFAVEGDARARFYAAETIWGDPESRTEGQHIDALLKLKALGVPVQQLWEERPYSPQKIARFRGMLAESAFLLELSTPAPAVPAPAPVPAPAAA